MYLLSCPYAVLCETAVLSGVVCSLQYVERLKSNVGVVLSIVYIFKPLNYCFIVIIFSNLLI